MLTAADKQKIAAILKVKLEDFEAAHAATEEVALNIPEGLTGLTTEDLTRVKTSEYNSGKTAGLEMAIKDTAKTMELDFSGKTLDGLIKAANDKALAAANIKPDAKVLELTKDIETLREANEGYKRQITEKETERDRALTDREIYRAIPSLGENAIAVDKVLSLMRVDGHEFKIENGALVPYKDGNPMKDTTANVLKPADVIRSYAKENKLISDDSGGSNDPKGRGSGNSGVPTKFTKLSELKAHFESQGKNINGQEFNDKAMELAANAEFDMNS